MAWLSYFPAARAAMMLCMFFALQAFLSRKGLKLPVVIGVALLWVSQLALLAALAIGLWGIGLHLLCEALGLALVVPRKDALLAMHTASGDKAQSFSVMNACMLLCTIPFGVGLGALARLNLAFPFALNAVLYGALLLLCVWRHGLFRPINDEES